MRIISLLVFILIAKCSQSQALVYGREGRSIVFTTLGGQLSTASLHKIRVTPYGNHIVRIQVVRGNEDFFPDNHYEMVESHQWPGELSIKELSAKMNMSTNGKGLGITIDKNDLTLAFSRPGMTGPMLVEKEQVSWEEDTIRVKFKYDAAEHFTGVGHGYFAREESIDLKGKLINRNYGNEHHQQAPLIVPYYLSSKGYGVFLNSTFPNEFNFGKNNSYEFSISGDGRMDYFIIAGPAFADILDRYTKLTGRPRLPLKSFFGLALSDKGNDHNSTEPSDEQWWKDKITAHRKAGFPLDHIVNDNRWRAGGGQRCVSYFDWDRTRYPDPAEYARWVKFNGLITTLDFNRCIAVQSDGWKPSFNLPETKGIEFNTSAPDLTIKEVRDWFWNLAWKKSLNPDLHFPGDALWIDEFDEMGKAPVTMKFENGTTWQEMKNYWFFLVAKALVQEGWDKNFAGTKRPFVWVRGMTAGAQRYATLWSGDITCTYTDMEKQVRGMQLAGLSGFPFWGHDAGGFYLDNSKSEPNDTLYRQWAMAFGSFTPFWKPHGVGLSRWPLDRGDSAKADALLYSEMRYRLIPYIYSYARLANRTGVPIARAMVIGRENDPLAWRSDLQYMWGEEFLVAPNCSNGKNVSVWLPKGEWFDFWTNKKINGGNVIEFPAPIGKLPLFVKAGSIVPMVNYAQSTAFIHDDSLTLHVYTGKDASFNLYEDDGYTENYSSGNEQRNTAINFNQATFTLNIFPVQGSFKNASKERRYIVEFHGSDKPFNVSVNGVVFKTMGNQKQEKGVLWSEKNKILTVIIPRSPVTMKLTIKRTNQ